MATEVTGKSESMTEHPPQNKEITITNPFDVADDSTDVVFLVEGEKLPFNKTVLGMISPVFKTMFTSEFKEKNAVTIPLPGKTLRDMVLFLEQTHPAHSAKPITDETIPVILQLADEYQVESVCEKCSQHISTQLEISVLPHDQLLLYLRMSDQYGLAEHRERLMKLATQRNCSELQKSEGFQSIPQSVSFELLSRRNATLEAGVSRIYDLIKRRPLDCRFPVNRCRDTDCCHCCAFAKSKRIIEEAGGQKHN